jgi:ABC-type transport system substrate-binding protein
VPLTSADVKWSLDQALPAPGGRRHARGRDATTPSAPGNAAGNLASIATVEAPDDSTVVLTLPSLTTCSLPPLSGGGAVLEGRHRPRELRPEMA